MPESKPGGVLRSEFAGDPDMAELVEYFLQQLPVRVETLNTAVREQNAGQLRRIAHQLAGSAASYGYPSISAAARRIDESLRDAGDAPLAIEPVTQSARDLIALCRSALNAA
jgi:HPt (histidine-containing phosphotransfer) domain-containing protein